MNHSRAAAARRESGNIHSGMGAYAMQRTTRREFGRRLVTTAGVLTAAVACGPLGQRPGAPKPSRIGYLGSDSQPGYERLDALVKGLLVGHLTPG